MDFPTMRNCADESLIKHRKKLVAEPLRSNGRRLYGGIQDEAVEARIKRTGRWPSSDVIERRTPDSELVQMDGCYLYAGMMYNHYGHIMTDSIHRLWAYDPAVHKGVVFVVMYYEDREDLLPGIKYPKYLESIVKLFGIEPDQIYLVNKGVLFEEMDLAMPGCYLGGGPENWYFPILEKIYERAEALSDANRSLPERLFMGRTHIIGRGTLMGESYFQQLLEKIDFIYFKPEDYSIYNQISIIKKAREIVFVEGSAIYGAELVAAMDGQVTMLPRRDTDILFSPHLKQKCDFQTAGDLSSIVRLEASNGKKIPKSPVITLKPARMHNDLAVRTGGLREVPFDFEAFARFQENDIVSYGAGKEQYIASLRSALAGQCQGSR